MRRARVAGLVALFGAVLLGAAALLRPALPAYSLGTITPKVARLTEVPGRYDCLVVGTSRIHHGFDPARFDEVLAARGHRFTTFNLGVRNLRQPELLSLLRRLRDEGVQGLRQVLIEWDTVTHVREGHRGQARSVWWHDPRNALWTMRREWQVPGPGQSAWQGLRNHAEAFGAWLLNVGRVAPALQGRAPLEDYGVGELGQDLDGYVPIDQADGSARARRAFALEGDQYRRLVEALRDPERAKAAADQRRMQHWIVQAVEALGARAVFFVATQVRRVERPDPEQGPVLYYDDPERHGEFYDPRYRFDRAHWNQEATRRFSELLARDLAALLAQGATDGEGG